MARFETFWVVKAKEKGSLRKLLRAYYVAVLGFFLRTQQMYEKVFLDILGLEGSVLRLGKITRETIKIRILNESIY
jgi:hypothetical protein